MTVRQKSNHTTARLTERDRAVATLLAWLPLISFFITTFPLPIYFLFRYFTVAEGAGEYMLFALVAAFFGSIAGLIVAMLMLIYRHFWSNRLRERLASDGVTVDELDWFKSELMPHERRTLKQITRQHAALADAYRETLAARITATQVHKHVKRELRFVERRLERAAKLSTSEVKTLVQELHEDRARLENIKRASADQRAEAEARLQIIEATASRANTESRTSQSLDRLSTTLGQTPLALESARLSQEINARANEELQSLPSAPTHKH